MYMSDGQLTWKFPKAFWTANVIELFERAAYYGMFIALVVFLTDVVGFTDVEAGWIGGIFAATLYLVPLFNGAIADKMGFRNALILAFALLTGGYFLLGAITVKPVTLIALALIVLGGSFVKPIIAGTVAKTTDEANRARGYSLFYQMVNIGAFGGKSIAKPLRTELGLEYINFYAAAISFIALIVVILFYKNVDSTGEGKSFKEVLEGFKKVMSNVRFMILILIVAGFWTIQGQLYATMPKYTLRLVGSHAAPEWYANVNPFIVVLFVVPITHLVRKMRPVSSIGVSLAIIPLSALSISLSPILERITGQTVDFGFFTLHPITVMMVIGIAIQGLAECFLSPRYYEFASKQAPKGEEGLYLGYAHLHTFFAWLFGFAISGYLLDLYCPDPKKILTAAQWQLVEQNGVDPKSLLTAEQFQQFYGNAHHIWYFFAGVGLFAFLLLLVYRYVTDRMDAKKAAA
ncbi:MAG: peptide MFS transporter [Calditrichia bacterium]